MQCKPKIYFKGSQFNGMTHFQSACPEADALFILLGRSYLKSDELPWVCKMGFDIETVGNIKDAKREAEKLNTVDISWEGKVSLLEKPAQKISSR